MNYLELFVDQLVKNSADYWKVSNSMDLVRLLLSSSLLTKFFEYVIVTQMDHGFDLLILDWLKYLMIVVDHHHLSAMFYTRKGKKKNKKILFSFIPKSFRWRI